MTMKKRITSFALVLLMVLSSLAVLLPVTGVKVAAVDESTTTPTEKTYTKVTTAPTDWSGEYLIVCEAKNVAFDGSLTTLDAVSNTKGVTITDGIISGDYSSYTFTIEKIKGKDGAYTIKSASGYFIGQTEKKNGLKSSQTTSYDNSIELNINSEGKVSVSIVSNNYTLKFNDASNQNRFRYYGSGQQDIQLYKPGTSSTPTEPDVPVHGGEHTYGEWTYNDTTHSHQCTIEGCKATETANHEITWTSLDANKHTGKCKCGYTTEGAHNWETDTEATSVPDGKLAQKCSACGEKRTIDKPNTVSNTATIDFSKNGYTNQQVVESYSDKSTGINVTFSEGSKYFNTGTAIRVYANGSFTIKGGKDQIITKITITFGSSDKTNAITAGVGTFNKDTWTGSANEVVFTIDGSSGHRRIKSLAIKYEAPATEPDTPKIIDSATLNIGTNIDVNYYVVLPEGISYEKYRMRFTFNGKTIDVDSTTGDKFTFKNVGPHQMGLNIAAVLYGVNGETETKLSEKATYSVKENLESLLASGNETVKTLAKNMLIYGAAAQKYTGAADADLVTSETHTEKPNLTTSGLVVENDATSSAVIKFVGMKLIFDNEPRLAIRYEIVSDKHTASNIEFADGNSNVLTHDDEYVYLNSVTANKFGTEIMIIDSRDDSAVMLTVNTYIYYILNSTTTSDNMKALATALYYYGVAAEAYVNAQTTQQ